jgi:hypothetical protein
MGAVGNGVCDHCMIFDSFQQCFARLFPTITQFGQGDSLSPYLFLFVPDGLSKILQHEVERGEGGLRKSCISVGGRQASHLLFADDTLLFLEAKEDQALLIREALQLYERCTGQLINPMKFSVMFGAHCM